VIHQLAIETQPRASAQMDREHGADIGVRDQKLDREWIEGQGHRRDWGLNGVIA